MDLTFLFWPSQRLLYMTIEVRNPFNNLPDQSPNQIFETKSVARNDSPKRVTLTAAYSGVESGPILYRTNPHPKAKMSFNKTIELNIYHSRYAILGEFYLTKICQANVSYWDYRFPYSETLITRPICFSTKKSKIFLNFYNWSLNLNDERNSQMWKTMIQLECYLWFAFKLLELKCIRKKRKI